MNARLVQAVVEAPVAVVLENGVVDGFDDPGALGSIGQLGVMLLEFVPQEQAAVVFQKSILVAEFLPPGLDGKIGLALRNDLFSWISVLNDQVTGVARHENRLDQPLSAFADLDHIVGVDEMILDILSAYSPIGK